MKTAIHAWEISQDTKVFRTLQEAAWSKFDVRTMQEWQARSEWTLRSMCHPLKVELQ